MKAVNRLGSILYDVSISRGELTSSRRPQQTPSLLRGRTTTDFVTSADAAKLTNMSPEDANEFLVALFSSQDKRGYIALNNGNVVLYNILEQKLLNQTNTNQDE